MTCEPEELELVRQHGLTGGSSASGQGRQIMASAFAYALEKTLPVRPQLARYVLI